MDGAICTFLDISDAIGETADQVAALTRQLLAFARCHALKPEVFDASASILDVAAMVRTLGGSRMALSADGGRMIPAAPTGP